MTGEIEVSAGKVVLDLTWGDLHDVVPHGSNLIE